MIEAFVPAPSDPLALLVLLLAGHVLADFLFRARPGAESERRRRDHPGHGFTVLAVHLAVVLPMLSVPVAAVVVGVTILHVIIDAATSQGEPRPRGALGSFVADQGAHVVVILVGWGILVATGAVPGVRWLSEAGVGLYLGAAMVASAFAFAATGGTVLVDGVLARVPDDAGDHPEAPEREEEGGYEGAGRLIGIIERVLVLLMALYGQWGAIALLIAAKSIARFEQIKVRRFAEYYLIGTLASLLVALLVGLVLTEALLPLAGAWGAGE